jgi:hydroxysqualene dehydroxylase
MLGRTLHVVGAGLSGLAAALRAARAGADVIVHEAASAAGGRCRSYHDTTLGTTIDNGNHLVMSGNYATLEYVRRIGAEHRLSGPPTPQFPFVDLATNERWCLRPNPGRVPWWIFDRNRRVPQTRAADYLGVMRLLRAGSDASVADAMARESLLYQRLWRPVLLAALNTDPDEASATLATAVMRETLMAGGHACRPLVAAQGLAAAFVEPALDRLRAGGARVQFGQRLRAMVFGTRRVEALDFGADEVKLAPPDAVVLAVPAWVATTLVPGLSAPSEFRAIVNAHFLVDPPAALSPITGIVNGTIEWIFAFADRLSVTISGADRLLDVPREALAPSLWQEVAQVTGLAATLPPWQIIKERRATFAALPAQEAKRPCAVTAWDNLLLAGDWTATGLPATIEGAIRSGNRAADLALQAAQRGTS